jgi:hypothetical protein
MKSKFTEPSSSSTEQIAGLAVAVNDLAKVVEVILANQKSEKN